MFFGTELRLGDYKFTSIRKDMVGEMMEDLSEAEMSMVKDWGAAAEPELSEVKVHELRAVIDQLETKRLESAKLSIEQSALEAEIKALEIQIENTLEANNLTRFDGSNITVSQASKNWVSVPQDPQNKRALFSYLDARGLYDAYVTVNSNKFNSWYNKELELALERGETGLKIPGVKDPFVKTYLQVRRRGKK